MKVWMVVDKSPYRLPCAVLDTLAQACVHIAIPLETAKTSFKRHGYYKGKYFDIIRVQIDD